MDEKPTAYYQTWLCLQYLSEQDEDNAHRKNGVGFSQFDSEFGHKLTELGAEAWTPKQAAAAHKIAMHYREQLKAAGIPIPDPPEPAPKTPGQVKNHVTEGNASPRQILADKDGTLLYLKFPYDADMVLVVKSALPGRRWNADQKMWTVPLNLNMVAIMRDFAKTYKFQITPHALSVLDQVEKDHTDSLAASNARDAALEIDGLGGELLPFQKAGVAYALDKQKTFVADEMGLGKTIEALATLKAANAFPALVICPASVKLNWRDEALKWLPGAAVYVLNGKAPGSALASADIVILNYDILNKWLETLLAIHWAALICDESHYCKNHKAQRTEAVKELAKPIQFRLLLTGTPILNRPQELISQLQILGRLDQFGGFWNFAKRYCAAQQMRYGWDMSGADHLDELQEMLRANCFVRRSKSEVLTELPPKRRVNLPVSLNNREEYDKAESDLIQWLRETKGNAAAAKASANEALVKVEYLKQLAATGKYDAIRDWVESFLETGEKLVLFAWHTDIVESLGARFNAPVIHGGTSIEDRQAAIDRFQKDPGCNLIVCNIQAGGVGITLTAASNVAFVELGWNPATMDQAEDRLHRIGQAESVTAWYLLAENTIDTRIWRLIENKRQVVNAVSDGILNELLGEYEKA
jgi:SWI/SNF-related matrix-associated actin-dependent regulator 1 of chromatin subfamily A